MLDEKRQALTRRANKLIGWLSSPDYAVYVDHESTDKLINLINLIIWALERSVQKDQWEPFRYQFLCSRYILLDTFENEEQEKQTYYIALNEVVANLKAYDEFINSNDISVVYSG